MARKKLVDSTGTSDFEGEPDESMRFAESRKIGAKCDQSFVKSGQTSLDFHLDCLTESSVFSTSYSSKLILKPTWP